VENAPASGATVGYHSHYTLYMGSSNSQSQFINCSGVLSFSNACTTTADTDINFQGYYNPNFLPVGFSGVISDTVLGIMNQGDGLAIMGGTDYVAQGSTASALYANTIYLQFGDLQGFLLASGANHVVFDGVGGFAKEIVLLAKQPSGGGATITWPTNVHFPTSPTVTLSTAANTVTKYRMTYIPVDNVWYAEVVGTGYVA
jgi:hypothetical protein